MNHRILTVLAAVSLLFVAVPSAHAASVDAHGQCFNNDDHEEGGGGSVGASSDDDPGDFDLLTVNETVNVTMGVVQLVNGTANNPDGDACPNTDDDDGDGFEEDEDHVFVGVQANDTQAGICVDDEGNQVHNGTHDECHTNAP